MYIIIVGCGRIGSRLALELSNEGHNVTIIERDPERFKNLGSGFNGMTITGLGIDEEVLRKAGIENADAFAALTPEDNINLMAAQIAKKIFHVERVIARNYKPELDRFYEQLGLDTICPTKFGIRQIKNALFYDEVKVIAEIPNQPIGFIQITANEYLAGLHVHALEVHNELKVVSIQRNKSEAFIPSPEEIIEIQDELVISIHKNKIDSFKKVFIRKG